MRVAGCVRAEIAGVGRIGWKATFAQVPTGRPGTDAFPVGAARRLRSLILIFDNGERAEDQDQSRSLRQLQAGTPRQYRGRTKIPVGAAAGCDLLIVTMSKRRKIKIRCQPSAAPPLTGYPPISWTDRRPVGAAASCDLLVTMSKGGKIRSKDRSLRQLLHSEYIANIVDGQKSP